MNQLREAAQALVDRWDTPLWKDAPHTGQYIDALRVALAQPEPPLSTGGWDCSADGKQIFHDDFEFDAKLKVSGDFATDEQRIEFAQMVTKTLNGALAQPEQEQRPIVGTKSWAELDGTVVTEYLYAEDVYKPEQEPVAWMYEYANSRRERGFGLYEVPEATCVPLYTSPTFRCKPLTDDDIDAITDATRAYNRYTLARAIERAHGIGGEA